MEQVFNMNLLTDYQVRTLKILTKSEQLLLRYGYSKVTIDDIARECGLGKGTIYLHFKSKENLFYAVFLKASAEISFEIIKLIDKDKNTVNFTDLAVESYAACFNRKLIVALFTGDSQLLGKLMLNKNSSVSQNLKQKLIHDAITMYRNCNYINQDMDINLQIHTINMLLLGMFNYNSCLKDCLTLEDQKTILYETIKKTLTTKNINPVNDELFVYIYNLFVNMLEFYKKQIFQLTIKRF